MNSAAPVPVTMALRVPVAPRPLFSILIELTGELVDAAMLPKSTIIGLTAICAVPMHPLKAAAPPSQAPFCGASGGLPCSSHPAKTNTKEQTNTRMARNLALGW